MKKQLKSIVCMLLVLAMCLALVACADTDTQPTGQKPGGNNVQPTVDAQQPADGNEGGDDFLQSLEGLEGLPETLENPDISIIYWYNPDQYEYDVSKLPDTYDPIMEAVPFFEQKYGGKVNLIFTPWSQMLQTVLSMQQSNDAPDLFEVYDKTMYSTILSGVCQPLDAYTTDADYGYYDVDKSLFSWEGSTYAIPLKPYLRIMIFNRDLFDMEGMEAPDELFKKGEWNWDAFREICNTMTKKVNGEISQIAYGGYQESFLYFMYANGGSMLNVDNDSGVVTPNLEAEASRNTLDFLCSVRESLNFYEGLDMFETGECAISCGYEIVNCLNYPFEIGAVPLPVGDDYEGRNAVVYPQGMAVPTGAKNPEGAVAFMRIVNELQKAVGDQREANRIGQDNYDMIYADDVRLVYAYDQGLNDADTVVATICNYITDGTPAATLTANVMPKLESEIALMYGG